MAKAHINLRSALAIQLLDELGLAATATNGFIPQNEFWVRPQSRGRHEEPLALTAEGPILSPVAFAWRQSGLGLGRLYLGGFQGFHRVVHSGNTARHCCHKPIALVVTAQEAVGLLLRLCAPHYEQEVTSAGTGLQNSNVELVVEILRNAEFKELATSVAANVHSVAAGAPARRDNARPKSRAHGGEFRFNVFSIHIVSSRNGRLPSSGR